MRPIVATLVLALALASWPAAAASAELEGTYELVSRDLPDGSTLTAPKVVGMLTYTKQYRNFNVSWTGADGTTVSASIIAKYRLTATEYQETPLYWHSSNLGAPGESYRPPDGKDRAVPVTRGPGRIEFAAPAEPPVLVFEGERMTATAKDPAGKLLFVDHWLKVR